MGSFRAALVTIATFSMITYLIYQPQKERETQLMFEIDEKTDLTVTSLDMNFKQLFYKWKILHSKTYRSAKEQKYRLGIFIENCKQIYNHNLYKDDYGYTFWKGLNLFSDLSKEQYLNFLSSHQIRRNQKIKNSSSELLNITFQCKGFIQDTPKPPDYVDWNDTGAVTQVLYQGQCGSSYAISAVGAVQGLYKLEKGQLKIFSYQQILDCSIDYGNQGCYGGFMDQAFWYIIDNGLATNESYRNISSTDNSTHPCVYKKDDMKATSFSKCADVPSGIYNKLLSAVTKQPTSAAINADGLQHYSHGIYNGQCSDSIINQAVLIVGYGTDKQQTSKKFWRIKSSFSVRWGKGGFFFLQRKEQDGPGKCGIQLLPVVPLV